MKHLSTLLALSLLGTANAQTTHELHVIDYEFVPAALSIELGDAIHLIFDDDGHTFTQVTQATWMSNDNDPLPGGYNYCDDTPNPGDDFTFTPTGLGTIYYVCIPHAGDGMKGTIDVTAVDGIADMAGLPGLRFAPNPARDRITLLEEPTVPMEFAFHDATGRLVMVAVPTATVVDISSLPAGNYQMLVRDRDQQLLAREQLIVIH